MRRSPPDLIYTLLDKTSPTGRCRQGRTREPCILVQAARQAPDTAAGRLAVADREDAVVPAPELVLREAVPLPAAAFMALGIYGQTVVVVPSKRFVIVHFGTTYDLRMAMVDISDSPPTQSRPSSSYGDDVFFSVWPLGRQGQPSCAGESSPQSRGGEPRALHERLELRPHDGRVLTLE